MGIISRSEISFSRTFCIEVQRHTASRSVLLNTTSMLILQLVKSKFANAAPGVAGTVFTVGMLAATVMALASSRNVSGRPFYGKR
jgi:hypothetical protein